MSTTVDQKAYLQKYLSGPSGEKKKKKKKALKGKGFKIIDDDIDLSKLRPLDGDELDILDDGEDGPQVAGIIDERPEEVKKLEQFKTSSKWRVVTQDDGFNSKLQIEEIRKDVKEVEKENELVFGKMYSDSEDEKKNDSDPSPSRSRTNEKTNNRDLKKKQQNNSDSDFSPPRKGRKTSITNSKRIQNSDSDVSPPRKGRELSPRKRKSPLRKGRQSPKRTDLYQTNERSYDLSPHRRDNRYTKERVRKPSRWGNADEPRSESPKRSRKLDSKNLRKVSSDSDASPPRKTQKGNRENLQRNRNEKSSESDLSPPRKERKSPERRSGKRKEDIYRNNKHKTDKSRDFRNKSQKEGRSSDSDLSPPRKSKRKSESPPRKSRDKRIQRDSSSDLSPPRKERAPDRERNYKKGDDSPPPSNKKMERTLEGKMAGLQNARQLREENEAFKRREENAFKKMTDDVSGRNAQAVSRKAKRETSEERQKQRDKAERQKELDEKYKKWSKGLKQIEAASERIATFAHEAAKPLARHRDDRDLERDLRQVDRDGDPMLAYIRDKKREKGQLGPEKPIYKGNFPPNRFNIRPGYRWDGVDRSSGYERKYFESQSKRRAQEEEAYKWSTEDL